MSFGVLDLTKDAGILSAFETIMSKVYQPALLSLKNWGDLDTTPQGRKTKKHFLDSYDNFMQYLKSK